MLLQTFELLFDENLSYEYSTGILGNSAGRAMSPLITKVKAIKDLKYNTYSTMYNACVKPILEYFSGIWGVDQFMDTDNVYKRAIIFT